MVFEGKVPEEETETRTHFVPSVQKISEYNDDEKENSGAQLNDKHDFDSIQEPSVVMEESLSLAETEKHLIKKALTKYNGRRKMAAEELGISERTLYRKIKEYDLA